MGISIASFSVAYSLVVILVGGFHLIIDPAFFTHCSTCNKDEQVVIFNLFLVFDFINDNCENILSAVVDECGKERTILTISIKLENIGSFNSFLHLLTFCQNFVGLIFFSSGFLNSNSDKSCHPVLTGSGSTLGYGKRFMYS
jgi:hypothetical protein